MLFGILGREENFLPKQLPFCPFILFFNLLKNRQKSNFTLYYGEKKFPLLFPSNIGRKKNCETHYFFFSLFSLPFSFLPHQTIHFYIFHLKIHSNFSFLPIFTSTKRTLSPLDYGIGPTQSITPMVYLVWWMDRRGVEIMRES